MTSSIASLLMVFALWLCMAIFCCAGGRESTRGTSSSQPAIIVTAPELISDYQANEIAADQRYKGRVIQVSGAVESIGKDIVDSMYITLKSGEKYDVVSVQCFFDDSAGPRLARLRESDNVTVVCYVRTI